MTDTATNNQDFWADADIIHTYTRDEAIADGVLISANLGDLDEISAQHFPGVSVAMTPGVFALIEKGVDHPKWLNDWKGVWHDVCWMSRFGNSDGLFKVIITGTGRVRNHILKVIRNAEGVTFMLRHED